MANPRMIHEFDEAFVKRLTFATASGLNYEADKPYGTANRHAPVKVTANKTVGLCADGDKPYGSLERIEADGSAVVAFLGTVTYAGSATAGGAVVADGSGGVRAADMDGDPSATPPEFPENGTGTVVSSESGVVIVTQ